MSYEILNGDCLIEMPKLIERGVRADLIFTSPPYNLGNTTGGGFPGKGGNYAADARLNARGGCGKWSAAANAGGLAHGYGRHEDAMPHEEYVEWQREVLRACWSLLSEDGAIYYNHKPRVLAGSVVLPTDYLPEELQKYKRQVVIWTRAGGINYSPTFYCPTHEWIVIIARPDFALRDRGASGVGDVWYVPQETDTDHPAPFPLELPKRAIETTRAQVIVDPFCGSGTTGAAAVNAGRDFYGIELEPHWCAYSEARLKRAGGEWAEMPRPLRNPIDTPLFNTESAA